MSNTLCPNALRIPGFLAGEICREARPGLGGARANLVVAGYERLAKSSRKKKARCVERLSAMARTFRQGLLIDEYPLSEFGLRKRWGGHQSNVDRVVRAFVGIAFRNSSHSGLECGHASLARGKWSPNLQHWILDFTKNQKSALVGRCSLAVVMRKNPGNERRL